MNQQHLILLAADILADPAFETTTHDSEGSAIIAAVYNLVATPAFWARRTKVSKREILWTISSESTMFKMVGNGFITRSAGELAAWQELFDVDGNMNPSLPNVAPTLQDIFSGTGNAADNRAHLLAICRRTVTRFEKLYVTGAGTTISPGVLVVEGPLTIDDVNQVWSL